MIKFRKYKCTIVIGDFAGKVVVVDRMTIGNDENEWKPYVHTDFGWILKCWTQRIR